nr:MAG TPA: hypothetical protein [Microviridae sp.]
MDVVDVDVVVIIVLDVEVLDYDLFTSSSFAYWFCALWQVC